MIYILKELKYKLEKANVPGFGEFPRQDILKVVLEELRETKWELEHIRGRLREVEKTLESIQKNYENSTIGTIVENDKEDIKFLSGEG